MCGRKSACDVAMKSRLVPFPAFNCLIAAEAACLLGLMWGTGALPPHHTTPRHCCFCEHHPICAVHDVHPSANGRPADPALQVVQSAKVGLRTVSGL